MLMAIDSDYNKKQRKAKVKVKETEPTRSQNLLFPVTKGLLQGKARRTSGSHSKNPNSPMVFREKIFFF